MAAKPYAAHYGFYSKLLGSRLEAASMASESFHKTLTLDKTREDRCFALGVLAFSVTLQGLWRTALVLSFQKLRLEFAACWALQGVCSGFLGGLLLHGVLQLQEASAAA